MYSSLVILAKGMKHDGLELRYADVCMLGCIFLDCASVSVSVVDHLLVVDV